MPMLSWCHAAITTESRVAIDRRSLFVPVALDILTYHDCRGCRPRAPWCYEADTTYSTDVDAQNRDSNMGMARRFISQMHLIINM
jgi:hypothetical protein